MKLNVGSGAARGKYRAGPSGPEGWVCFDLNPQGRPHVVGDAFKMPFKDNAFEEIHCIHVLEHLGRDKWPIMLAEMFRVLTPDGQCYVEVPDFEAQCVRFIKALQSKLDPFTVHKHRTGIWGKPERLGMGHQYGFDRGHITNAFHRLGFQEVKLLDDKKDMISTHYKADPVILIRGTKTDHRPAKDVRGMSFDELREFIII